MIRIAPHVAWNCQEGELALFDERDGSYHALNETGAAIWRAIDAGGDRRSIGIELALRFDAPRATIESSIEEFIVAACEKGLLEETP